MSNKLVLILAAIATLTSASAISTSAFAYAPQLGGYSGSHQRSTSAFASGRQPSGYSGRQRSTSAFANVRQFSSNQRLQVAPENPCQSSTFGVPCSNPGQNPNPPPSNNPPGNKPPCLGCGPYQPPHVHWQHWKHWKYWYAYRLRTTPVVYQVAPQPVAGPCTCLTKQYTPEGAVLFKDICTNEAAINPPVQAVVPQQTGMYQTQPLQMLPQQPIPQAQ